MIFRADPGSWHMTAGGQLNCGCFDQQQIDKEPKVYESKNNLLMWPEEGDPISVISSLTIFTFGGVKREKQGHVQLCLLLYSNVHVCPIYSEPWKFMKLYT